MTFSAAKRCASGFGNRAVSAAILIVLVLTPGAFAKYRVRFQDVSGTRFLYLEDIATYFGMAYQPGLRQATLSSQYSRLVFTRDRRECDINGFSVHLSHAPLLAGKAFLISNVDFEDVLKGILRGQDLPRMKVGRIMIDPGHGGNDNGTRGVKYLEKDIAMAISLRLADQLRQRGYLVSLTRSNDRSLSLSQRPAIAARWNADLLISIHANYVGTSRVSGVETFLLSPPETASTYGGQVSDRKYPGNRFDPINLRLAYEVHKSILNKTSAQDRGVKHARFLVLKETPCPAILVETGFMSNRDEELRLGTVAYQEKIAVGIAEGILRFHRAVE